MTTSGASGLLFEFGLEFVAAGQVVQSAIEEIAYYIIEFLDAVEFERDEFAGDNFFTGEFDEAVFTDIAAKMFPDEDQGVNDLAHRNALTAANAAPLFVLGTDGIVFGVTNPIAKILEDAEDTRIKLFRRNASMRTGVLVGENISDNFSGE